MMHHSRAIIFPLILFLVMVCFMITAPAHGGDKKIEIAPFPVIYYSPETSLGLGAMAVITFRDEDGASEERPDALSLMASYTFENQIFLQVTPTFYFNDQKGLLTLTAGYADMPTRFYGIGNEAEVDIDDLDEMAEEYSNESTHLEARLAHSIFKDLRFGVTFRRINNRLYDKEDNNTIDQDNLLGNDGGVISGMGPFVDWDTRDNMFYPSSGAWYRLEVVSHLDEFDSDFEYDRYHLDLRRFFKIKEGHILAVQAMAAQVEGDVPFTELLSSQIRGIDDRFFVDEKMLHLQAEYRFPIYNRFSGAGFIAIGDVQPHWDDFEPREIKYGGGAGIRYALNPNEKINIRFDIAISPWGVAPYIMLQEMF